MSESSAGYSELNLIEQPAIELLKALGWESVDCFHERVGERSTLGRETTRDVVLVPRLRAALERLNPELPPSAVEQAIEELTRDRSTLHPVVANREVYRLIRDGVTVMLGEEDGGEEPERVRVIDWDDPTQNDYFLASQFWVSGEIYKRRADLVGFVNGLPLVFIELKAVHRRLRTAYDDNLTDYRASIPQMFWYNAAVILSNGSDSRVGAFDATWEHFAEWKKIADEEEPGIISLETMIRGICEPRRLLDYVENFILYSDESGGLTKIIAKNHQVLGVNRAVASTHSIEENRGRLGVFWHTQGSGKSYSMVFFGQKVLRKLPGNWTFLVVTDRQDLDEQIYGNFQAAGAVTEKQVQAGSSSHLRRLLTEDHRYVFTLVQKFRTDRGERHPVVSDRSDVIVIADEAHRTQYDVLAQNMRDALPNAAFIGFTATPLVAEEERTREVFGDYVSVYDFKESVEDRATVPLFYENRIPELQLTNENLNAEMQALLEVADLDEEQERRLEREFSREYHLITRNDRIEKIAEDIVEHFMGRGYLGKAMVVSVDKATAVRMYDQVRTYWARYLEGLRARIGSATDEERADLEEQVRFMEETDMAVVVSQAQNEVEEMRRKGLDIAPHRRRMVTEDLAAKFKKADDPLRLVFVCAMWMTGFDARPCSTVYLDKPMRNHALMQTIARANRVFGEKTAGLIVDYVGIFRNLEQALAIYGTAAGRRAAQGEMPIRDKVELIDSLRSALDRLNEFCREHGVDLARIPAESGFQRVRVIDDAVEAVIVNDDAKWRFLGLSSDVVRLFKAILPDHRVGEFIAIIAAIEVLAARVRALTPTPDISGLMDQVGALLDRSVAAEPYVIREEPGKFETDISKIDFDALRRRFDQGHKRTEAEQLRSAVNRRLQPMVQRNRTRLDYLERFQLLIDDYNAGAVNVQTFFERLVELARDLDEEEKRTVAEGLSEPELALFDLLTKPDLDLTEKEAKEVKKVARELLNALEAGRLVLDWRKRQRSRAEVRVTIEDVLDRGLPDRFTPDLYREKCDAIYQHVYDSYFGEGRNVYEATT